MNIQIDYTSFSNPVIEFNASEENHRIIRSIMTNNQIDSEHYGMIKSAKAFWQSGSENDSGWIMIEIWNTEKTEEFFDYLLRHLR